MEKMIGGMMTVAEAAAKLGVSRQRVHQLCVTYGVDVVAVTPRMKMIPQAELAKIPTKKQRQKVNGVRIDHRKPQK